MAKTSVHFVSGDVHVLVTHETVYEGSGLYWVSARAGHDEFSTRVTIPLAVFGPADPLAYHKAARDVLQEAITIGKIPAVKARWMRHRSGDDGGPMLVLIPTPSGFLKS